MREAIVLAGGLGTRLRGVVTDVPKPMAPISGRPFLEILLNLLSQKGFSHVVLSLGFMADSIKDYFHEDYQGIELDYSVELAPLGTGGAIRLALSKCQSDHVFIFNGDTYLDLEIEDLDTHWASSNNPIIVGREVPDTSRYGRLVTTGGRLIGFTEKGISGPGMINAGSYVINRGQLDHIPINKSFSFEMDYLSQVVKSLFIDVFVTHGHFIDIGVPEDFHKAQIALKGYPDYP